MTRVADPRSRLHVLGVRHHSPACARLVQHRIAALRPSVVLIEGPADMNPRLEELLLPHRLPIAVFTYHRGEGGKTESSWTPFCDYSPEHQALKLGAAAGAEVRFMDLPAWHPAFHGVSNRYGDHDRRRARAVEELCERFHVDGYDALWDHLFEGPCDGPKDLDALAERLKAYFAASRGGEPASERDEPREEFMRAWIRAALARVEGKGGGDIVVVCGGFHAPAFEGLSPADSPEWPEAPASEDARSYLVPWSYHRLDAFSGYESGMPSPGFYERVFSCGSREAPERALKDLVARLREKGQPVSAADLIAAMTLAQGLARLRGHDSLRRTDLLDGIASALVKQSLDAPLPWSERGVVRRAADALLVEVLRALSGEREGRLHESTPRPALLGDVEAELSRHELAPQASARAVELELHQPNDLAKSRILHRLRVLQIPGFARERGPVWTTDPVLEELWTVARHDLAESALIEAASFGATLAAAAARRLEEALLIEHLDLGQLASLLGEAVFIGVDSLTARALAEVRRHAGAETDLGRLGEALERLLGLWTQDVLFGAKGRPELGEAVGEAYERGLWLLENLTGGAASADGRPVAAVRALRDAVRTQAARGRADAAPVFARRAGAADSPPDVRGACLGATWSLGQLGDGEAARAAAVHAVRQAARPQTFGDFLAGLFALAREETVHGDEVLAAVDEVVSGLDPADFLAGLPSLRLAFSYFPPREKAALAERLAARHGKPSEGAALLSLDASAEIVAEGHRIDAEVEEQMRRYGLLPSPAPR